MPIGIGNSGSAGGGGGASGAAGGDLSGTYPNPTVAKVAGTTPGTGVATALGVNVGSAGAVVVNGGALGTPSSGDLTNCTNAPVPANITIQTSTPFLTVVGSTSASSATGADNTAVGYQALNAQTTGTDSTALGFNALKLSTGNGSTAVGSQAGKSIVANTGGTFIGYQAGQLVTGADNTVCGYQAGDAFTTGARNSLFGKDAGGAAGATAMSDCTFLGYQAGLVNTGNQVTAVGSLAGSAMVSNGGSYFGYNAGSANTATLCSFFGSNCGTTTNGARNTYFGASITNGTTGNATGTNNVFVGNEIFGYAGTTGSTRAVLVGSNASVGADSLTDYVAIGYAAGPTGSNSISIGSNSTAAANQFVAGASTVAMNNVFFGKGATNATATAYTINGTGGSGSNNAGADVLIAGGKGTGTSKGGNVGLKRSPSIATGSTAQTLYDGYILVSQGKALTDNTATTVATWTLASGSSGGGCIDYRVQCTDGTDYQSVSGIVSVALVNKGGTYTSQASDLTQASAVSAGTCAVTWSITAAGAVQVTADTSLTPSGTNAFVIYYSITNNGEGNVTLP